MEWALRVGANALEMDLVVNTSTGYPSVFHHECRCHCLMNIRPCPYILGNFCEGPRDVDQVLGYFMAHEMRHQVNMIYIDTKVEHGVADFRKVSHNIIMKLSAALFEKGFGGLVVIFASCEEQLILFLAQEANKSDFHERIFLSCERDVSIVNDFIPSSWKVNDNLRLNLIAQSKMNYSNILFSTGTSMCLQGVHDLSNEVTLGRINSAKGLFSEVAVWTVNNEAHFDRYFNLGARGIMTDNIEGLVAWAKSRGYQLHDSLDHVPRVTSDQPPVIEIGSCHCSATHTGCVVSSASPLHSACHCKSGSCVGVVVGCSDMSDIRCAKPDTSLASCRLGSGDCSGYTVASYLD